MIAPAVPSLRVVVPGEPVAQGRPRAFRMGAALRVVDPAKSRSWKGVAQVHALALLADADIRRPAFPTGPLTMTVDAYFTRKHFPKRVGPERQPKPSRPDADNIGKCCLDAMNDVLYGDDAQVVELVVRKWYCAEAESPGVEIQVEPVRLVAAALAAKK